MQKGANVVPMLDLTHLHTQPSHFQVPCKTGNVLNRICDFICNAGHTVDRSGFYFQA